MDIVQLGPYRIVRELGRGGMGTVYEGLNVETGQRAAVKLLAAPIGREDDFRERFEAEIETLKRLRHPNIVRLFGFGRQARQLFYTMELIDGHSLEEELERGRRFDWREVAQIGIDVCQALRHAHDRGVIHRDIKPGNLLLAAGGQVILSDFGIARLFGNSRLTGAGNVVGTAEYMAPEQAEGRPVTPRSDLYSLGGVFYALLTRRPPFRGRSLVEILQKQRFEQPDPVSDHAADVPMAMEQIVGQLLEKDPERRIPNAAVLSRQLQAMQRALSLEPGGENDFAVDAGPDAPGAGRVANAGPSAAGRDRPEVSGLATTRLAVDPSSEHPSAGSCSAEPPAVSADDLLETRATAAFKGPQQPQPAEEEDEAEGPGSQFITVDEEELDHVETGQQRNPLISLQTWVLAGSLIGVGLVVWYLLQPPTADALHARIAARAADGTIDSLRQAEDDIQRFLGMYSNDPRCEQLRQYVKEIELDRLQREFELRVKGLAGTDDMVPVERAYLEAVGYLRFDQEKGLAKLEALIDLYDHRTDTAGPCGQCVELARRQAAQLREQVDQQAAEQLALVQDRLEQARQLGPTDADRARSIYRAVIELYGEKPWAAEVVGQAEDALDALSEAPGAEAGGLVAP